ncbi:MAG: riboflavin synthase, partial [Nitrospirota bacterium]|nr:riboflavin synthase [Nitrospirota bacterium]
MFSGIVEEMGAVQAIERGLAGAKFSILASAILEDLQVGESVSVSGACLTATIVEGNSFSVDVSTETMNCTFLSKMTVGTPLNLERAMKLNARIGGHLVTGHVDGVGILRAREQDGNALYLTVEAPDDVIRYCVPKGSITMDG